MNRTSVPLRHALGVVCVSVMLLAACGTSDESGADGAVPIDTTDSSDDAESAPAETEPSVTVTEPVVTEAMTEPPVTEPVVTEPVVTEPVVTEPASIGLPDCLIGDWVVTEEELDAYYSAIGDNLPGGVTMSTTGTAAMTFTATEYTYSGDFTLDMEIVGQTATGAATGSATGTWVLIDDVISAELSESDVDISVTVAGVAFDGGDLGNRIIRANPVHQAPVSCDGPTISSESGDDARHPILLTPA